MIIHFKIITDQIKKEYCLLLLLLKADCHIFTVMEAHLPTIFLLMISGMLVTRYFC